jgi:hypothetical protein
MGEIEAIFNPVKSMRGEQLDAASSQKPPRVFVSSAS